MSYRKLLKEIQECGEEPVAPDPVAMERIPGGLGHKADPGEFDQVQLMHGIHVELEHGSDVVTAMEIAMDHLSEDPYYYVKLMSIEEATDGKRGYFTDLQGKMEAFVVDNDTDDDVKDLRGQNAEKTGGYNLATMKLRK